MAKINEIKDLINQMASQCNYQTEGTAVRATQQVSEPVINIKGQDNQPMAANASQISNPHQELVKFIKTSLIEGKDYGSVPGVHGSFLFKQGAVKIMAYLRLRQEITLLDKQMDIANKLIAYTVKASLVSEEGVIVTEAIGSANSQEGKFVKFGMNSDPFVCNMAAKRALVAAVKMLL